MWVPSAVLEWFQISKDTVDVLREELASIKTERDSLKDQVITSNIWSDFLRMQVNTLQFERAALMEAAHGIRVPTPELTRLHPPIPDLTVASFEDMGDETAKRLGLPIYNQ